MITIQVVNELHQMLKKLLLNLQRPTTSILNKNISENMAYKNHWNNTNNTLSLRKECSRIVCSKVYKQILNMSKPAPFNKDKAMIFEITTCKKEMRAK